VDEPAQLRRHSGRLLLVDPVEALEALGGAAGSRSLLRLTTARKLRTAISRRQIIRIGRGRFRLPDADRALAKAIELGGMVSHLSAAQWHGWELPFPPALPWVSIPRNAKVRGVRGCELKWADPSEERGPVTSPLRTVIDCMRVLPFPAALTVADSARRHGDVDSEVLVRGAAGVRGKGAAEARRVAEHASPLAANPFESVLRGIALDAGLEVRPQSPVPLGPITVHPDVVDRGRRLVIEAESWEWHSGKEAFQRDCWRYTMLVVDGWTVLRFTWWQVMHEPDFVRSCLLTWAKRHGGQEDAA
jgi:very-short-patch-repair endonuclease